ncbi:Phosphate regulon transcriptional regulatory protein PhoB [compost metagenome]
MAKHIVIIEDDPNILELLVYLFEDEGYQISSFSQSQTANHIQTLLPDVVLLDVNLSGSISQGDEICKELKKLVATSQLPVMLLSAEKDLASIAKKCNADAFLCKPFDIGELMGKVRGLVA